ncbi:MAG: peptidoglycan DD-metalloendopeptidase family protein [Nodularia sp. CChRGM 3473]
MTQRNKSAHHRLHNLSRRYPYGKLFHIYTSTLPAQSFFVLSSLSFLSGGLALAQTETSIDNIVPTVENSQPTPTPVITKSVKKDTVSPAASRPKPEVNDSQAQLIQKLRSPKVSQPAATVRTEKPKVEVSQPAATVRTEKPKVEVSQPAANVRPEKPKVGVSQPAATVRPEKPKVEVAKPATPRTLPEKLPEVAQPSNNSNSAASTTAGKTRDYNNAYIDPTRYNANTAGTYQAPSSVVLTERSSGCQTVLPSGQNVSGSSCAKAPQERNQRVANSDSKAAPNWLKTSQNTQVANVPQVRSIRQAATTSNNSGWRPNQTASSSATKSASRPNRFIPNPSDFATTTNATPIAPSGETLPPPMAAGNVAPRPSTVAYDFPLASVLPQIPFTGTLAYRGDGGMIFPLSIPARITSVFGWRTHPITGDRRFHAGTDLGAPMGTPVVAAARGQVDTANWLGGYGLTVIVNHASAQQTLYAHMSELFVQPGQWVEQGTVIGRVGSTGNSTGPHLHFEVRHLKPEGWVAVDSGVQLQVALSQLVEALQTAQVTQQPGS